MIILLLQKLLNEEEFNELAWCYVHEQEIITQEIMEKWLKQWIEQYEKDLHTRSVFVQEILMLLNDKKFEFQEIKKLKEKLNTLGFKSN